MVHWYLLSIWFRMGLNTLLWAIMAFCILAGFIPFMPSGSAEAMWIMQGSSLAVNFIFSTVQSATLHNSVKVWWR